MNSPPPQPRLSKEEEQIPALEVQKLLEIQAIEHTSSSLGFFSPIFIALKKDGG